MSGFLWFYSPFRLTSQSARKPILSEIQEIGRYGVGRNDSKAGLSLRIYESLTPKLDDRSCFKKRVGDRGSIFSAGDYLHQKQSRVLYGRSDIFRGIANDPSIGSWTTDKKCLAKSGNLNRLLAQSIPLTQEPISDSWGGVRRRHTKRQMTATCATAWLAPRPTVSHVVSLPAPICESQPINSVVFTSVAFRTELIGLFSTACCRGIGATRGREMTAACQQQHTCNGMSDCGGSALPVKTA